MSLALAEICTITPSVIPTELGAYIQIGLEIPQCAFYVGAFLREAGTPGVCWRASFDSIDVCAGESVTMSAEPALISLDVDQVVIQIPESVMQMRVPASEWVSMIDALIQDAIELENESG